MIDAEARSDLHPVVRRSLVRCPRCGRADPPTEPTLVLCTGSIGLLVPGAAGLPDAPPDWLGELGWEAWPGGPPLLLIADRAAAAIAIDRSLADDAAEPERAEAEVREAHRPAAVATYMQLVRETALATAHRRRMELIGEATVTPDEPAFLAMLERHPELLGDDTLAMLDAERAAGSDVRLDLGRQLLVEARTDPRQAWREHHARVEELGGDLSDVAESWEVRLDATSDPDELIELCASALAFAEETGNDPAFVAGVLAVRAHAHLRTHSGRRDEHISAAARDYREALALLPADNPMRSDLVLNAGTAIAQQVGGDARAHAREAAALLDELLASLDEAEQPDLVAMIRTNLAQTLLTVARRDDAELFRRARDLCDAALTYRSPERNVEDWAYSIVNRGAALERLAELGEATRADAEGAYRAVVEQADQLSAEVAGHAKLNLLAILMADLDEDDDEEAPPDHAALAQLVSRALEIARDSRVPPITRGRALHRLAHVQHRRGATDEALAAWREALPLLVGADLRATRDAAWQLASVLADLRRWEEAAVAYRAALDAVESLVSGPRDVADRTQHAAAANRLPRWAAHAFVACGALEDAVLTLENGRTRELRRQLQLEDPQLAELERLMPYAVAHWRAAADELVAEDADLDVAGAALDDALARIRAIPSFERFGLGADLSTVQAAAADRNPVVYVNPAPHGTTLLRVDAAGGIDARSLPVTSQDVVYRVLFGIDPTGDLSDPISYTLATAGRPDEVEEGHALPEVDAALDRLLPWVGEYIAAAIDALLTTHGDEGAVLVAYGPLATVPLAAATFDGGRTLLDRFVVATTPSATAHAAARRRAIAVDDPLATLVAVADPTEDLDFARAEVEQIAGHFATARVGAGVAATRGWLSQHAADATSVHLACHGFGGMVDATESGLVLADGALPGVAVARLPLSRARLAVASACQSGVTEVGDLADEAFSLGTALLGAGAACAIASLWSVDDLATAMLMTRLYEHLAGGMAPAEALVEAQRWLRSVGLDAINEFLARHPVLAAERERSAALRSADGGHGTPEPTFSHPVYWAAFVVLGA